MSVPVNSMHARRNELLTDVATYTADLVRDYGMSEEVASQIGFAIADALAERWGGQYVTIPKDHFYQLSQRDRIILEAHRKGESYASLARAYKMAERSVRRLIRRAELRDRNHRQQQLFGE